MGLWGWAGCSGRPADLRLRPHQPASARFSPMDFHLQIPSSSLGACRGPGPWGRVASLSDKPGKLSIPGIAGLAGCPLSARCRQFMQIKAKNPHFLLSSGHEQVFLSTMKHPTHLEMIRPWLPSAITTALLRWGVAALEYPACTRLLGPIVPGTIVPHGARVPGTPHQLDPVQAAFDIGTMIRWLDFNDCWLAAEWGHPSDNLGAILAVADWRSRTAVAAGRAPMTMRQVLTAMIKAHEIQGCLALENAFNRVGIDHVILVKLASTAVVGALLGLTRDEIINALSLVFVDGQALRTYRHAPNT